MLCTLTWKTAAYGVHAVEFYSPLTVVADTTRPLFKTDTTKRITEIVTDTTRLPGKDSSVITNKVDTFSLRISKDTLEAPLKYAAEDSAVVLIQAKKILLYGKTKTEYKDITLTAPQVPPPAQPHRPGCWHCR